MLVVSSSNRVLLLPPTLPPRTVSETFSAGQPFPYIASKGPSGSRASSGALRLRAPRRCCEIETLYSYNGKTPLRQVCVANIM